jgi:chromosome segregation ATPase
VDQQAADVTAPVYGDVRSLESSLKALWERARHAGELITDLRGEKKVLLVRVEELENELAQVRQELARKEQLIKKITVEGTASASARGSVLSNGERDAVVVRIKELLAKLEAYL